MSLKLFGCVCGQFHSPAAGMGMAGDDLLVADACNDHHVMENRRFPTSPTTRP